MPPHTSVLRQAAIRSDNDIQLRKVTGSTVSLDTKAGSRATALSQHYDIPTTTPTIGKIIDSYAKERGWIEDEKLYALNDYNGQKMLVDDYTEDVPAYHSGA